MAGYKFFILLFLIFLISATCDKSKTEPSKSPIPPKGSIADIIQNHEQYLGKEVEITSQFMGWQGADSGPPVTKSDWVIKDDTGAIYVFGPFPPGCRPPDTGIGKTITVNGIVKITKAGQVYIQSK